MILIDYGALSVSNMFAQMGNHTNTPIEENLLRHMVLTTIRSLKVKFGEEYGEVVIACDSRHSWRKDIFPYYKANRKKERDATEIDWPKIFEYFANIRDELAISLPYRVIHVDGAEADDIIGTLVFSKKDSEKILIISKDKDFRQLHCDNVKQWNSNDDVYIEVSDATEYLAEHIIKGDATDGVPNILSGDNFLAVGIRQKPITKKRLEQFKRGEFPDDLVKSYWERNRTLIDLSFTPQNIQDNIHEAYKAQEGKTRDKLISYFMEHKLKDLLERLSDF